MTDQDQPVHALLSSEPQKCIYIQDLAAVDLDVQEQTVRWSHASLTDGTYTKRSREGGNAGGSFP